MNPPRYVTMKCSADAFSVFQGFFPEVVKTRHFLSPAALLTKRCSKAHSDFSLAWLRCEEQSQLVRGLYTCVLAAHTAFAFTAATAATNPNWTWAIGPGAVDARCILKLERSPRTPSQGCHFVMHYAYMQMPDKEMDYLKGHLWFSAQRYMQQGKWSEHSHHLVGAQLYGEVEKHSFRQFSNSKTGDDW